MAAAIDLSGRVALICGAGGGGIGTATSRLLCDSGAEIIAVDRSPDLVDETISMVEQMGGRCNGIVADLRDPRDQSRIVPDALAASGRIDLLANIAGGIQAQQWGRFENTPDEVYRDVMALNLDYVFAVSRDAAKAMIAQKRGGAIVNVSSVSALPSAPFHSPYAAAKSAVVALSKSMAVELGRYGVRVNVVAPGATKTQRAQRLAGDSLDRRQAEWAPLQRPVSSEDVAEAIRFLLADNSRGITGQLVAVDCGLTARSVLGGIEYFESRLSF